MKFESLAVSAALAVAIVLPSAASASSFLISEWETNRVFAWAPGGAPTLWATTNIRTNDVDYNRPEGADALWGVDHYSDRLVSFPATGGPVLGDPDPVGYAYPKHVAVYNGDILVSDRNSGRIVRYDQTGAQINVPVAHGLTGQGVATDGTNLFNSVWTGSSVRFNEYDSSFGFVAAFTAPTGLGGFNNIFDLAYSSDSDTWFGLATSGEGGTGTRSSTVVEFIMGGAVVQTYALGISADGIGQFNASIDGDVPVPAAGLMLLSALGVLGLRRATRG